MVSSLKQPGTLLDFDWLDITFIKLLRTKIRPMKDTSITVELANQNHEFQDAGRLFIMHFNSTKINFSHHSSLQFLISPSSM